MTGELTRVHRVYAAIRESGPKGIDTQSLVNALGVSPKKIHSCIALLVGQGAIRKVGGIPRKVGRQGTPFAVYAVPIGDRIVPRPIPRETPASVRARVLESVRSNPGITAAEIGKAVGMNTHSALYHLNRLLAIGAVRRDPPRTFNRSIPVAWFSAATTTTEE